MSNELPSLQQLTWSEARNEVIAVNSELAAIIDNLSPDKNFPLLKARYAFGQMLIQEGVAQLPTTAQQLTPINSPLLEHNYSSLLSYSPIPLLLTLKNANEVFIHTGSRVIPLNLFNPGSLLGLFESLDYIFGRNSHAKWNVSAGARTFFALPKISESGGFKRLKAQYNLPMHVQLKNLADHWQVFTHIARHPNFSQSWFSEILLFTRPWLDKFKTDSAWHHFYHYLFQHAWQQAQFAIGKIDLGLHWETFAEAIANRNLKPIPYLADQAKHILAVAAGRWPGIRPVLDNSIAPLSEFEVILTDIYQLKHYLPTLMHACPINFYHGLPVYYSLYYPTLLEGSAEKKSASTIMLDLKQIKLLLDTAFECFNKKGNSVFSASNLNYYHVEEDKHGEIKLSKHLLEQDASLLKKQAVADRSFCTSSSFWRGCISIKSDKEL